MKYTHKRYCKATQPDVRETAPFVQPVLEQRAPLPKLEPTLPTDEQISAILFIQKTMKANKEREQMSNLFKKALPQEILCMKLNIKSFENGVLRATSRSFK